MKRPLLKGFSLIAAWVFLASIAAAQDKCLTCHETIEDKPSELFKRDVHFSKGISCAACHGGDSKAEEMEEAMAPSKGYIGVPKGNVISQRCATCHSDSETMKRYGSTLPTGQWEQLQASVHGKLAVSGNEQIGQCTTCHGAHGIVSAKSPSSPVYALRIVKTCATCHANASYMRLYNPSMAVDQLEKYRTSVHGVRNAKGDVNVAECASCHGSHDIRTAKDVKSSVYPTKVPQTCAACHSNADYMKSYKIPTDQFEKFASSVHGKALLEKKDVGAPACNSCHGNHGATPPGVSSISKVCGTCHALNADLFSSSPHKKAFDARKLPECETCHSNHAIVAATDELLGVTSEAVCSRCHTGTENAKGFAVAQTMRSLIEDLERSVAHASALVDDAEQKGMEVGEAKFKLRDARQARLQSRTMVHSFNEGQFREIVEPGLKTASTVTIEANEAIEEYFFRRIGLGVATLIITILAFSLYWYIRRLEHRQSHDR